MKKISILFSTLLFSLTVLGQIVDEYACPLLFSVGNESFRICLFNNNSAAGTVLSICNDEYESENCCNHLNDWKFTKTDDGFYFIVNDSTGLYLQPQLNVPVENSKIIANRPIGNDNQKWTILSAPGGCFYLLPKLNDELYLSEMGGKLTFQKFSATNTTQKFYSGCACPYVSAEVDNSFVDISEILRNIRYNSLKIKIDERKDEITFIDYLYLEIEGEFIYPEHSDLKLLNNDNDYVVLNKGEFVVLNFKIPQHLIDSKIFLKAKGYYEIVEVTN
jgi:hypothetical protein